MRTNCVPTASCRDTFRVASLACAIRPERSLRCPDPGGLTCGRASAEDELDGEAELLPCGVLDATAGALGCELADSGLCSPSPVCADVATDGGDTCPFEPTATPAPPLPLPG